MKITGIRPYLSIGTFEAIELPKLTVLVGRNGAGKSHLIDAIAGGSVHNDVTAMVGGVPVLGMPGVISQIVVLRPNDLLSDLAQGLPTQPQELVGVEMPGMRPAKSISPALVAELLAAYRAALGDVKIAVGQPAMPMSVPGILDFNISNRIVLFAQQIGKTVGRLTDHEFRQALAGPAEQLFANTIVGSIKAYRDAQFVNDFYVTRRTRGEDVKALDPDAFISQFGLPPWEQVSTALAAFGLPFDVPAPTGDPLAPLFFQLRKRGFDHTISFDQLSSGERTLIRFVLSLFKADDADANIVLPKLVLMDEMDALLHPAAVRRWFDQIIAVLTDRLDITVVLATHSPTTVAIAPEGSIFEMSEDQRVPRPVTKQHAINQLTVGLPMLSLDYSGQRQVFVESGIDVKQYSALASILKDRLNLPRALTFISASGQAESSNRGGWTVIKQMIEGLHAVPTVFGLFDWDLTHDPTNKIKVLAHGTHYTKENVLLDPLLIAALIIRYQRMTMPLSIADLATASTAQLQTAADVIIARLGLPAEAGARSYFGGFILDVPTAYQHMNGHELEELIKRQLPEIGGHHNGGKRLIDEIIKHILTDYPQFTPQPIVDAFVELATC